MTPADLIITGGDVRTMNPDAPRVHAVAITGDRIIAVGSDAEIAALAGPRTQRIDAAGNTVMPGIIDAHNHVRLGANPGAVSLFGAQSLEEIRTRISRHLADHPDLEWIEGEGWNYAAVPGGRPTAAMIDDVCGGKPAWLFSYDVHTAWLNTEGLRRFNAAPDRPDLPFGNAEIDDRGELTGWVHDFAVKGITPAGQHALEQVLPGYHIDAQYGRLVTNLRAAVRYGITTIVEPQNGLDDVALFQRAQDAGELKSRLIAGVIFTPRCAPDVLTDVVAAKAASVGSRIALGPIKLYIDDVIEPHTAAMLAPYANHPGRGTTFWPPETFAELIIRLEDLDLQAFVHATGDRGIRTALDAFAAARRAHSPRDTRHQIVHVECLDHDDVGRFADLGVVACMQPRHCAPDLVGDWRANVGPDRERYAWAMRSLADSGATLAFSSDWNVADMDPMVGIYTALTRADLDGNGAWNTAETLDLDTTLRAYTTGSAYANFLDHDRGSIEPGKLADIIVLSRNLHTSAPREILDITVTHTLVGGDIVHQAA